MTFTLTTELRAFSEIQGTGLSGSLNSGRVEATQMLHETGGDFSKAS